MKNPDLSSNCKELKHIVEAPNEDSSADFEAEPYDPDNLSDDDIKAELFALPTLGEERVEHLMARRGNGLISRNGDYIIVRSHSGYDADFSSQANYLYLKRYKFLDSVGDSMGFGDYGEDLEALGEKLAVIDEDTWSSFLDDLDKIRYEDLDPDYTDELRYTEVSRFVSEDGTPDLIKSLADNADSAYDEFLFRKIQPEAVFEWMDQNDIYPEDQGNGSVYVDMALGDDREVRDWWLAYLPDDVEGWTAVRAAFFNKEDAGDMFEATVRELANSDPEVAHAYATMDGSEMFQLFLRVFPDEHRNDDDPYWFFYKPLYGENNEGWYVGYAPNRDTAFDWRSGFAAALDYVKEQPWFRNLIVSGRPAPEDHPEFKFEAMRRSSAPASLTRLVEDTNSDTPEDAEQPAYDVDNPSPEDLKFNALYYGGLGEQRLEDLSLMATNPNFAIQGAYGNICYYEIDDASNSYDASFGDRANYNYLLRKYPFLMKLDHELGFDPGTVEDLYDRLSSISEDSWDQFVSDMEALAVGGLDANGSEALYYEEVRRWASEEGRYQLMDALSHTDNAYDEFIFRSIDPEDMLHWLDETDTYPVDAGNGSVTLNFDNIGVDYDTQRWFIDNAGDNLHEWTAVRYDVFKRGAGDLFEKTIREMAEIDEDVARAYASMDAPALFQLFLRAFPNVRRSPDAPHWYYVDADAEAGTDTGWHVGYAPKKANDREMRRVLLQKAFAYLKEQPWFRNLIVSGRPAPEDHPEFKFESERVQDYSKSARSLFEDLHHVLEAEDDTDKDSDPVDDIDNLSVDDLKDAILTSDIQDDDTLYLDSTLWAVSVPSEEGRIYHIERSGFECPRRAKSSDIFLVFRSLEPVDGRVTAKYITFLCKQGCGHDFIAIGGTPEHRGVYSVLDDPVYGKRIRKVLVDYISETAVFCYPDISLAVEVLNFGGPRALRKLINSSSDFSDQAFAVELGIYYGQHRKYAKAAKVLGIPPEYVTAQGVWLDYNDCSDLSTCFRNPERIEEILHNDATPTADYLDLSAVPDVKECVPYLDKTAIDHIRSVMVNRSVWFPEGGEDGRGAYVVLTKKILAEYDDATLLSWIAEPSDDDEESGVWDDIREAIKLSALGAIGQATDDKRVNACVKACVAAIDGVQDRWAVHPVKRNRDGTTRFSFQVQVQWTALEAAHIDYKIANNDIPYQGSLEGMMVAANDGEHEFDFDDLADLSDLDGHIDDYCCHYIFDIEVPDPIPGSSDYYDPKQLNLPIGEGIDDPEENEDLDLEFISSNFIQTLKHAVEAVADEKGISVSDFNVALIGKSAEVDELDISFCIEGELFKTYGPYVKWKAEDPIQALVRHFHYVCVPVVAAEYMLRYSVAAEQPLMAGNCVHVRFCLVDKAKLSF